MKAAGLIAAASALCLVMSGGMSSEAHDTGASGTPPEKVKDQTIVDVSKVTWAPLTVDKLQGGEIAVLRGDLAKGEAEVLLRFPAGFHVPNHSHTSDETYVWLQGAFSLVAHDGTRTKFDGPAFISFPGNAPPHALECGGSAPCILYVRYQRPFDIQYFPEPERKN